MSRRRDSAMALNTSEVVAARGKEALYSHYGICQAEGTGPFLSREQLRDRPTGVRIPLPVIKPQHPGERGGHLVLVDRFGVLPLAAARPFGTNERHPDILGA